MHVTVDLVPGERTPEKPSERVYRELLGRMGEWAPGEKLPAVAELAAEYDVARQTVARVLARLEREGYVRVISRWGTFRA